MGGQIGARSLPEGGSEFWVVLALVAEKPQTVVGAQSPEGLQPWPCWTTLPPRASPRRSCSPGWASITMPWTPWRKAAVSLREAAEAGASELVLLVDDSVVKESGESFAGRLGARTRRSNRRESS